MIIPKQRWYNDVNYTAYLSWYQDAQNKVKWISAKEAYTHRAKFHIFKAPQIYEKRSKTEVSFETCYKMKNREGAGVFGYVIGDSTFRIDLQISLLAEKDLNREMRWFS